MGRSRDRPLDQVDHMTKLTPREAVKLYQVSRTTLMSALENGTISAEKTDAGHWQIDPSELMRVYQPRAPQKAVSRSKPDQIDRDEPAQKTLSEDLDLAVRLARAEAALEAEREKTALLERHLSDMRLMLPAPAAQPRRRRWWLW
jgi:hypothetical protein